MENIIAINEVGTSKSQIRPQGDPVITYLVNVESSKGLLTLEFTEKAARDMSAHLTHLLPKSTEE